MRSRLTQGLTPLDRIGARVFGWSQAGLWAIGLVAVWTPSSPAQPLLERSPQLTTSGSSISAVLIERPPLRVGSRGPDVKELQALLQLLGYYSGPINSVYDNQTAIGVANFQTAAGLAADGVVGPATWERLLPVAPVVSRTTAANLPTATSSTSASTPLANNLSAAAFPAPNLTNADRSSSPPTVTSPPASEAIVTGSSTASPTPSTIPNSTVELPILRLGMQGSAVIRLQERLRVIGVFAGEVDGVFGPTTETAVKAAQQRYQLEPDGVVGPATWQALLSR